MAAMEFKMADWIWKEVHPDQLLLNKSFGSLIVSWVLSPQRALHKYLR